jgi:hypothetical protein
MSENQLMDKLVAGFDEMSREMQFRIGKLDSEISELNHKKKETEDRLANFIPLIKEREQIKEDWLKKYDNARIRGTQSDEDYAYNQWEKAKNLLDIQRQVRNENQSKLDSIKRSLSSLTEERNLLQKKLSNLSFLSAEAKGETYYRWLVEGSQKANSEYGYAALAKKFSDISEYRDCATLAERCRTQIEKLKEEATKRREIQAGIEKLNAELNEKLKPLDDTLENARKKVSDFKLKKTLTISSIIGAAIGCIVFFLLSDIETVVIIIGIPVVTVLCRWWLKETDHWVPGCLFLVCSIACIILLIGLLYMESGRVALGVCLLCLLGGAGVSAIVSFLYKSSKKRISLQELAILEKTKADLRSEYDKKKEEIIKALSQ